MKIQRTPVKPVPISQNSNILSAYPIEKAAWIWHPDFCSTREPCILRFDLSFNVKKDDVLRLHLSADHRYEAFLDEELISRGPDRSDVDHWSFASYSVEIEAGTHHLSIRAWWIGSHVPVAQMSSGRGGFILAGESLKESCHDWESLISTGKASWTVFEEAGWSFDEALKGYYHVIGSALVLNAAEHRNTPVMRKPSTLYPAMESGNTGLVRPDWRLSPSPLPDQIYQAFCGGRIAALLESSNHLNDTGWMSTPVAYDKNSLDNPHIPRWQKLLTTGEAVKVEANSKLTILWDLEEYFCGYPEIQLSGGSDSSISILWAESLYEDGESKYPRIKGHRDKIDGKIFYGFGDRFFPHGEEMIFRPLWFRSGRYIQISIKTGKDTLTLKNLKIMETRYPLEEESTFKAEIDQLNGMSRIAVRTLQMCAHETLFDCPYYEQLMYVGDSRLQNLTAYTLTGENRLAFRAVELFRLSHHDGGFIHERYPSFPLQRSPTFALIWVSMVRDLALWRPAESEMKLALPVIRYQLDNFRHYLSEEGLLGDIPGWSFVDWVPAWDTGYPPGATPKEREEGNICSSIINLLFVMALKAHADLEICYGDELLAQRSLLLVEQISRQIINVFWDEKRNLLADNRDHSSFSEHAQCLGLINEIIPESQRNNCFSALLSEPDLHRTTVYFTFYLVETYRLMGRPDLFLKKLDFWRDMLTIGLKTTLEMPEPSRSDSHAWGAYPYYFFRTFLAGITPGEFAFKSVLIEPQMADLPSLFAEMPHPEGKIIVDLIRNDRGVAGKVVLPEKTPGVFRWKDKTITLKPGENQITLSTL
jgi:alpha-L-rhamnosidase